MNQIYIRVTRDATQRIVGGGNKIAGRLKELDYRLRQLPREALSIWRRFSEAVKQGKIVDNLRAVQLKATLTKIPIRTLKDACSRVFGNGSLIAGKIKELEVKLKQVPR